MWASLAVGLLARPWARQVAGIALAVLTVVLFILNLRRTGNKHLAFGFGVHQCAGLSLARLEGRIAIGRFLQRFPDYQLTQTPVRGGRARFRGFLHAPFSIR